MRGNTPVRGSRAYCDFIFTLRDNNFFFSNRASLCVYTLGPRNSSFEARPSFARRHMSNPFQHCSPLHIYFPPKFLWWQQPDRLNKRETPPLENIASGAILMTHSSFASSTLPTDFCLKFSKYSSASCWHERQCAFECQDS